MRRCVPSPNLRLHLYPRRNAFSKRRHKAAPSLKRRVQRGRVRRSIALPARGKDRSRCRSPSASPAPGTASLARPRCRFLHALVANWISAGVRLVPLGQTDGQRLLAALEETVAATAARALATPLEDVGSAAFRADLATMLPRGAMHAVVPLVAEQEVSWVFSSAYAARRNRAIVKPWYHDAENHHGVGHHQQVRAPRRRRQRQRQRDRDAAAQSGPGEHGGIARFVAQAVASEQQRYRDADRARDHRQRNGDGDRQQRDRLDDQAENSQADKQEQHGVEKLIEKRPKAVQSGARCRLQGKARRWRAQTQARADDRDRS